METSIEETAEHLVERIRPQIEDAKRRLESLNSRVTTFVSEHPGACLLGAVAAGYLIARLARRQRS